MNMNDEFPPISKALLEHLEKQFPAKVFTPSQTIEQVMFYSGQRQIVEMLRHQYNYQNESVLNPNVK
jgi:hypothetical protein|tara:strand:+ start:365 stop:565 length:201 start_codon:yes stop_codon:yes gene_type:complete